MIVTIQKSLWNRGHAEGGTVLRNDGTRCILGWIAKAYGVPDALIWGRGFITNIPGWLPDWLTGSDVSANNLNRGLSLANDELIDDQEIIDRCTDLLKDYGVVFRLVD